MSRRVITIVFALAVSTAIVVLAAAVSASKTKKYGYVTSELRMPTDSAQAKSYARDIDGDGHKDNAFGAFIAAVAQQNVDFQGRVNQDIADGDLLMLHELRTPSFVHTKKATWQVMYAEQTPTPDFSGSGSFAVASGPSSPRLPAKIKNHHVKTAAGNIPLRLDLFGGIFTLKLKKAKVFATCSKPSCSNGRINGAITVQQINTVMLPKLAAQLTAIVTRDCPGPDASSCQADSEGKNYQELFDTNNDLTITTQELQDSPFVQVLLAPDLDLVKGNGKPGQDGVNDAMSIGVGFEAVRAHLVR
jgi:hypothetical protein